MPEEYDFLYNKFIFGYFHLNSPDNVKLKEVIDEKSCMVYPYEDITDENGGRPCLYPMSVIAGRLAVQKGAQYLESQFNDPNYSAGKLLGGVPGVSNSEVLVIGAGVSGTNAASVALGMGANVTVMDVKSSVLIKINEMFGGRVKTIHSNEQNLKNHIKKANIVIGAVFVPGRAAPKIVSRRMIESMSYGSVFVDIAIDEGGCCELSIPTSHEKPIMNRNGVKFYCVPNIPALVPKTSTIALTNETMQHIDGILTVAGAKRTKR